MKEDFNHSNRRLAAIMFTDMVGYSQLMQKNEAAALKLLENQWKIVEPILNEFGGKRIKTIGDAFYTQFHSVLKALNCALSVQRRLSKYNATRHFEKHITLRIGIHLGDVEIKGEDAYGDGVNIAARIEPLAEPGGIAISEDVHRQVVNKVDNSFKPLGKPALKNIHQQFKVYQVILPWQDRRKKQEPNFTAENDRRRQAQMHSKIPKVAQQKQQGVSRPVIYGGLAALVIMTAVFLFRNSLSNLNKESGRSIAVLPFENMTDQTGSDYFSDGVTEDIISALAEIEGLRVIARTSILQYKGTNKTVVEIAKELNVNTILEGSVRRIDDNVRVVAQLIDIETDDHLWANTYDRKLDDIFAVQTDIAMNIANALEAELSTELTAELASSATLDTRAYENYLKGKEQYYTYTEEGFREAVKYHNQALDLDPNYALAYAELANAYGQLFYVTKDDTFIELGYDAVEKALSINLDLAEAYKARGLLTAVKGKVTESLEDNLRAIQLKPGYANAIANVANIYSLIGDLSETNSWHAKSYAIDPNNLLSAWHYAINYLTLQENSEGLRIINNGLQRHPDSFRIHNLLFYHSLNAGDLNEARKTLLRLEKVRENDVRISDLWTIYYILKNDYQGALTKAEDNPYPPTDYNKLYVAYANLKAGNVDKAEAIISKLETISKNNMAKGDVGYHPHLVLAMINAIRVNFDQALIHLENAVEVGFRGFSSDRDFLYWLKNPIFFGLSKEQRFISIKDRLENIIKRERVEAGFPAQAP